MRGSPRTFGIVNHSQPRRGLMTKEELIAKMAASAGITKVAAGTALEAFTGAVTSSLKKGQRVSLVNFGTFTISKRKARMGRNPRTGESLKIPAAKVPKFSAGKELRSAVK
jgi:DNA-binding protein HU-beta